MSDSEKDPLSDLLSSFALGPAWARAAGSGQKERETRREPKSGERPPRRDDRGPDERRGEPRVIAMASAGHSRDAAGNSTIAAAGRRADEEAPPAEGVRVTLVPDAEAVHLIGKEIHQVARVYPLFDVAKILLAERGRCRAVFEAPEPHAPLFRGKLEDSVFLTREEAVAPSCGTASCATQFIEEETIEVDPPTGNFQLVAKCGLSGEWLGPPNFHAYQVNLRRLHRERFPNMPFAAYSAKVRTERGEEAVNAWLETMKKKTRWRIKGDADDAWIEDRTEAERALATRCFDQAFEETRHAEVLASVSPKNLSPSLMTSLKMAGNHARNHPAILIPAVCKAVEAEHLPVFKRQGKLLHRSRPAAPAAARSLARRAPGHHGRVDPREQTRQTRRPVESRPPGRQHRAARRVRRRSFLAPPSGPHPAFHRRHTRRAGSPRNPARRTRRGQKEEKEIQKAEARSANRTTATAEAAQAAEAEAPDCGGRRPGCGSRSPGCGGRRPVCGSRSDRLRKPKARLRRSKARLRKSKARLRRPKRQLRKPKRQTAEAEGPLRKPRVEVRKPNRQRRTPNLPSQNPKRRPSRPKSPLRKLASQPVEAGVPEEAPETPPAEPSPSTGARRRTGAPICRRIPAAGVDEPPAL